jgi:hypothetical protein
MFFSRAPNLAAHPASFTVSNPVAGFTYVSASLATATRWTIAASAAIPPPFRAHPDFPAPSPPVRPLERRHGSRRTSDATLGAAITNDATVSSRHPQSPSTPPALRASRRPLHSVPATPRGRSRSAASLSRTAATPSAHTSDRPAAGPLPITVVAGASLTFSNAALQGGAGASAATLAGTAALTLNGTGFNRHPHRSARGHRHADAQRPPARTELTGQPRLRSHTNAARGERHARAGQRAQLRGAGHTGIRHDPLRHSPPATNGLTAFWYNGTTPTPCSARGA